MLPFCEPMAIISPTGSGGRGGKGISVGHWQQAEHSHLHSYPDCRTHSSVANHKHAASTWQLRCHSWWPASDPPCCRQPAPCRTDGRRVRRTRSPSVWSKSVCSCATLPRACRARLWRIARLRDGRPGPTAAGHGQRQPGWSDAAVSPPRCCFASCPHRCCHRCVPVVVDRWSSRRLLPRVAKAVQID